VAEAVHDCERGVKAVDDRIAQLEADQAADRTRLGAEIATLEEAKAEARAARDASANEVERTLRIRYDRLRAARTTAVVVALRGEACGACFTAVPRHRRTQIRAGMILDNCEACGVILYAEEPGA
jgi:predicted  nucleic acid-binding Zn-ribbon protein